METETLRAVRRALRWLKRAEKLLAKDVQRMKAKGDKRNASPQNGPESLPEDVHETCSP